MLVSLVDRISSTRTTPWPPPLQMRQQSSICVDLFVEQAVNEVFITLGSITFIARDDIPHAEASTDSRAT